MSDLRSARIRATAAELGLTHLAEALDEHIRQATEAGMDHLDLIGWVLSEELAVRRGRGFAYSPRLSGLSHRRASPRGKREA
ncbi:ATP-binding protein [Streptomyces sp. NPDC057806]|uniref:ATP-binding protein n=1 Tax=Streptomyces sp. NPDC057806 TaxID=3346255 RepID=UPI0036C22090